MELKLEVLNAERLSDGQYRFGDFTIGLLGMKTLCPYVVAKLDQQTQQSNPVNATMSQQGASAVFEWTSSFEMRGAELLTFRSLFRKVGRQFSEETLLLGRESFPCQRPSLETLLRL